MQCGSFQGTNMTGHPHKSITDYYLLCISTHEAKHAHMETPSCEGATIYKRGCKDTTSTRFCPCASVFMSLLQFRKRRTERLHCPLVVKPRSTSCAGQHCKRPSISTGAVHEDLCHTKPMTGCRTHRWFYGDFRHVQGWCSYWENVGGKLGLDLINIKEGVSESFSPG